MCYNCLISHRAIEENEAMPKRATHPTPHAEVNALLRELLVDVQAVLGDRFVGMYLYGSLTSGGFNPQRSDIDFVVVTDGDLLRETVLALKAMHARIRASGSPWAERLEGDYVPQEALRRHDPARARYPHLGVDGHFEVEEHGSGGVIGRYQLRGSGLVLAGPPPHSLVDPVGPDDLRRATLDNLHEWWAPMLRDPARLQSDEYRAYAVLTMCRTLYTLRHGAVVSKAVAARWAQEALVEPRAGLAALALAWGPGEPAPSLDEALAFIRHTLDRAGGAMV
jgi:hypothetical protein